MLNKRLLALAVLPFVLAGCSKEEIAIDRSTKQKTVEGYISTRYVNDYSYKNYCVFKTGAVPSLIDRSMEESLVYQNEYYSTVSVSNVTYSKTSDMANDDIASLQFQNIDRESVTYNVSAGEIGVATYHWVMTPNDKGKEEGVADVDGEYSKTITLLLIENEYFVYLTVH